MDSGDERTGGRRLLSCEGSREGARLGAATGARRLLSCDSSLTGAADAMKDVKEPFESALRGVRPLSANIVLGDRNALLGVSNVRVEPELLGRVGEGMDEDIRGIVAGSLGNDALISAPSSRNKLWPK